MKRATLRFLLPVLGTLALAGCANPGPPLPPSLELPKPVTDLRATRKGDKVYLFWTVPTRTVDRQFMRHLGETRICRSTSDTIADCGAGVAVVPASQFPVEIPPQTKKNRKPQAPKVEGHYTDTLPAQLLREEASTTVTYAISIFNSHDRTAGLSNLVQVPAIPALPPPANFHAEVTSEGVSLHWDEGPLPPSISGLSYLIRIYRRPADGKTDAIVGEVPPDTTTLTDHGFEWEKSYNYRGTAVTMIAHPGKGEIPLEGDDTPTVQVAAHDVFPPAVPSGLQAVASGVGQQPGIDLVWTPVIDSDLAGYNLYRHEAGGTPEKINRELLKSSSYRDTGAMSGHTYFYSVSAADVRGNESSHSEEAQETLP